MDERVQILKDWMTREERGTVWMARKVGRTKSYISHILHERMPMTDKLARELRDKLGVPMPDSQGTSQNGARNRDGAKGSEEGRNGSRPR